MTAKRILPTRVSEEMIDQLDAVAGVVEINRSWVLRVALEVGLHQVRAAVGLGRRQGGRPLAPDRARAAITELRESD